MRVERAPEALGQPAERQDDQDERDARGEQQVRRRHRLVEPVGDQRAERGRRRVDAGAEEGQRHLERDRVHEQERGEHQQRAPEVRQQLGRHQPPTWRIPDARAASTNCCSRSASTWPRSGRATYGTYTSPITRIGISFEPDPIATGPDVHAVERERGAEQGAEQQRRERPEQVEQPADDRVGAAAAVAGSEPERDREQQREEHRARPHRRATARAPYSSRTIRSRPFPSAPRKNSDCQVGPIGMPSSETTSVGLPSTTVRVGEVVLGRGGVRHLARVQRCGEQREQDQQRRARRT